MRLLTTRSPCRILVTLGILLAILSTGCGLPSRIRCCHRHKSAYPELYGVEEGACHGYQPTCWRQWNNGVCSSMCNPPCNEVIVVPKHEVSVTTDQDVKVVSTDEVTGVSTNEVLEDFDFEVSQVPHFELTSAPDLAASDLADKE